MKEPTGIGIRRVGVIMTILMFNRLTNRAEFNRMLHLELIILSKGDLFKE